MTTTQAKERLNWFIRYLDTCPEDRYCDVAIIAREGERTIKQSLEDFYIHVTPTNKGMEVRIENN